MMINEDELEKQDKEEKIKALKEHEQKERMKEWNQIKKNWLSKNIVNLK